MEEPNGNAQVKWSTHFSNDLAKCLNAKMAIWVLPAPVGK